MNIPAVSASAVAAPSETSLHVTSQASAPAAQAAPAPSTLPTASNQRAFGTLNAFDTPASQKAKLNWMAKELIEESAVATGQRRIAIRDDLRQVWSAMGYAAQEQFAAANVILQSMDTMSSVTEQMGQLGSVTPTAPAGPAPAPSPSSSSNAGQSAAPTFQAVPATRLVNFEGTNASGDAVTAMGGEMPSATLSAPSPLASIPETTVLPLPNAASASANSLSTPPPSGQIPTALDSLSQPTSTPVTPSVAQPAPEVSNLQSPPMTNTEPNTTGQPFTSSLASATQSTAPVLSGPSSTPSADPIPAVIAAPTVVAPQPNATSTPVSAPAPLLNQTPSTLAATNAHSTGTAPAGFSVSTQLAGGADPDVGQWRANINLAAAAQQVPANLLGGMLFEHGQSLVSHGGLPTATWSAAPQVQQAHKEIIDAMKAQVPQSFVGIAGEAQNVMGVAARLKQDYDRLGSWELATHSYIASAAQAAGEPSGTPLEDVAHSTTRVLAWWRGLSTGQQLSPSHNPASIR